VHTQVAAICEWVSILCEAVSPSTGPKCLQAFRYLVGCAVLLPPCSIMLRRRLRKTLNDKCVRPDKGGTIMAMIVWFSTPRGP